MDITKTVCGSFCVLGVLTVRYVACVHMVFLVDSVAGNV